MDGGWQWWLQGRQQITRTKKRDEKIKVKYSKKEWSAGPMKMMWRSKEREK